MSKNTPLLAIRIAPEQRRALRMIALQRNITLQKLVEDQLAPLLGNVHATQDEVKHECDE